MSLGLVSVAPEVADNFVAPFFGHAAVPRFHFFWPRLFVRAVCSERRELNVLRRRRPDAAAAEEVLLEAAVIVGDLAGSQRGIDGQDDRLSFDLRPCGRHERGPSGEYEGRGLGFLPPIASREPL